MSIRETGFLVYDEQPLKSIVPLIYKSAPEVDEATVAEEDGQNSRASRVSWITPAEPHANEILEGIWPIINDANAHARWNFDLSWLEPLQFTKYTIEERYDWHVDTLLHLASDDDVRKLSFSVLLNDEFEGGEFELEAGSPGMPNRIQTLDMKAGDVVVFPSYMWHRVKPVTSGERHSLVGWVHGPNWR